MAQSTQRAPVFDSFPYEMRPIALPLSPWEEALAPVPEGPQSSMISSTMELCRRAWAYTFSASPETSARDDDDNSSAVLEQLDRSSHPADSAALDVPSGDRLEVSSAFVLDLGRLCDEQVLFIQGKRIEPPQNEAAKVIADLFALVGNDRALLRTLTEVCSQRAWIDLKNFVQNEYFKEKGTYPIVNNYRLQTLSIHKDAEGGLSVMSSLEGEILYECWEGKPVDAAPAVPFRASSKYDLKTQSVQRQHIFG